MRVVSLVRRLVGRWHGVLRQILQMRDQRRDAAIVLAKEGGELVISFAYMRKIPLFGNMSLVFDFEGSSVVKQ